MLMTQPFFGKFLAARSLDALCTQMSQHPSYQIMSVCFEHCNPITVVDFRGTVQHVLQNQTYNRQNVATRNGRIRIDLML